MDMQEICFFLEIRCRSETAKNINDLKLQKAHEEKVAKEKSSGCKRF